jgi:ubiquinone/menaquinone biosynthesis C-methylase UbiE
VSGPRHAWYESAFDREYLEIYAHRDARDAERALAFLEREQIIHPGDLILDLCCGNGRHSLRLCERGYRVHGFDLSLNLLLDFLGRARCPVPLVRGDMRRLAYRDASFDVVLSLFTSFGYFETDEENWQVLREVARVLKPGGRFVLDFLNAARVRADLRPHSERVLPSGLRVVETRRVDAERGRVVKSVEIRQDSAALRDWVESVRLYTLADLEAALSAAGLSVQKTAGDFDSSPHADHSPRLIVTARRIE